MKKGNRGFTLIELLVVIAILTIITGGSLTAFSLVQSGNTSRSAETLCTSLQELRIKTMTQNLSGGWQLKVYKGSDDIVYIDTIKNPGEAAVVDTVELKKAELYYSADKGATYRQIDSFSISYKESTGAVSSVSYMQTGGAVPDTQSIGTGILRLKIGSKESDVYIYFATGKCEVK